MAKNVITGKVQKADDRRIVFGDRCAPIPERLLLAHARGEVLFITGAGTSMAAGLPDFRGLVLDTYKAIDLVVHDFLQGLGVDISPEQLKNFGTLDARQSAEVKRFLSKDYDVVLGMLERRMDQSISHDSKVRRAVIRNLRKQSKSPAPLHHHLIKLADRGGVHAIATTNFDRLLETAAIAGKIEAPAYSLGAMPRPSRRPDFAGIFHIHGMLSEDPSHASDFIISDQDFGEFYLRRRVAPDFIYDAARLFHLVLVGYSANDPPMRYLLNAVAADGNRFSDFKERFTFVSSAEEDQIMIEDWKGRGITPILYSPDKKHFALQHTFDKWSDISPNAYDGKKTAEKIAAIIQNKRSESPDVERDLFDFLIRRSNPAERNKLAKFISEKEADFDWLDALGEIAMERI